LATLVIATVVVGACGGSAPDRRSEANPVTLPGAPGFELPGLDDLPQAQRVVFEDGTVDAAEYAAGAARAAPDPTPPIRVRTISCTASSAP
jgi:hypothetical protein